MRSSYKKGVVAESIATQYLTNLGYKIEARRWKSKFGEIDIIAIKEGIIVFIEVKSRNAKYICSELISLKQQRRNSLAALDFIGRIDVDRSQDAGSKSFNYGVFQNPGSFFNVRYDFIVVVDDIVVEHIENAWYIE